MKKKFVPNKYICYLYFFIPLFLNAFTNYSANEDIWYIMRYGKIILEKGFIHTDILSIHSGLHIVIQQAFSNILFYGIYHFLGDYGFFLLCEIMIGLYLWIMYKICMLLSNKNILLSVLIPTITCSLLETTFITPRPQIFTYFHLLLVIYILEKYTKEKKTKAIYFLPLISLLQINFHGALWYSLFLFMLPYIAEFILKRDKRVWKLLGMMGIMFLIGFINPYTYENVFFPFTSYDSYMNPFILELNPINIVSKEEAIFVYSIFFYIILSIILLCYIYYKKGKLELRHLFLLGGTVIMSLVNVRSIPLFLIGGIIPLANYFKALEWKLRKEYVDTKKHWAFLLILIGILASMYPHRLESRVKKGGDYLKKHYDDSIILYTDLDYGSYVEYLGFHSYMDTRAEVFFKKANKKVDIFPEAMSIQNTCQEYQNFIDKYHFTHMIVNKESCLYQYLKEKNTKIIFKEKEYVIFEIDT